MQNLDNYHISTLKNNPNSRINTIKLLEESFHYSSEYNFEIDFHPLLALSNAHNNNILIEKSTGEIVAHIGAQTRFLKTKDMLTPVILLGGIAVSPSKQNQGLFRPFMNAIINKYTNNNALIILWGNLTDLYNKFDFYEAGILYQTGDFVFNQKLLNDNFEQTKFNKLTDSQFDTIKNLHQNMASLGYSILHRSNQDWENIKNITSTDLYLYTKNKIISGYFCINKGFDLQDIIHEIVFNKNSKNNMINNLSNFKLWVPSHSNDNTNERAPFYMGFFKIGNSDRFKDFISNWSNDEIEIVEVKKNLISYKHMNEPMLDTTDLFLKKIFGPDPYFNDLGYGPPLYLSGLDSI